MKSIINTINEGKKIKIEEYIDFDVQSDIYNVLGALAYEYDKAGKGVLMISERLLQPLIGL